MSFTASMSDAQHVLSIVRKKAALLVWPGFTHDTDPPAPTASSKTCVRCIAQPNAVSNALSVPVWGGLAFTYWLQTTLQNPQPLVLTIPQYLCE
jgi:hypothetical protein